MWSPNRYRKTILFLMLCCLTMPLFPRMAAATPQRDAIADLRALLEDMAGDLAGLPGVEGDAYSRARVDELERQLRTGSEIDRAVAATNLATYAGVSPRALSALLEAMGDPSATVRSSAALAVLQELDFDDGDLAPRVLTEALRDPDSEIRAEAARRLGRVAIEPSVMPQVQASLQAATQDPERRVRRVASRTLNELGVVVANATVPDPEPEQPRRRIATLAPPDDLPPPTRESPATPPVTDARVQREAPATLPQSDPRVQVEASGSVPSAPSPSAPSPSAGGGSGGIPEAIRALWPGRAVQGLDERLQVDAGTFYYSGGLQTTGIGLEKASVTEYPNGTEPARLREAAREGIEEWGADDEMVRMPGAADPGFLSRANTAMQLLTAQSTGPGGSPEQAGELTALQNLSFYCGNVEALVEVQIPTGVPWRRGRPGTIYEGGFEVDEAAAEAALARLSGQLRSRVMELASTLASNLASRGYCR